MTSNRAIDSDAKKCCAFLGARHRERYAQEQGLPMRALMRLSMLIILALEGCAYELPIEARPLATPNPTSYIYPVPIAKVRKQIDALCLNEKTPAVPAFETSTVQAIDLCIRDTEGTRTRKVSDFSVEEPIYTVNYRPELQYDEVRLFLRIPDISIFSKNYYSRTYYFKDGGPRPVYLRLKLIVRAMDENRTFIELSVLEHRAFGGRTTGLHFSRPVKWINLRPTTIEEYEVILDIGKRLNVQGMPKLRLPSLN